MSADENAGLQPALSAFLSFDRLVRLSNQRRRLGNVLSEDVALDEVRKPDGKLMLDIFARGNFEYV